MELYQSRTFTSVAELGHLTGVPNRLHIGQPAVSAQFEALEDELAVPLFRVHAGELYVLDHVRLTNHLWFFYRTEREHDPGISALIDVVQTVWP